MWGCLGLFFHHIDVKEIDWLSKTLTVVDTDEESRKIAKPKSSMFLYALHHSPLLLWPHCFGRPEDATCYWWGRVGLTPHTPHPPFLTRQPPPTPRHLHPLALIERGGSHPDSGSFVPARTEQKMISQEPHCGITIRGLEILEKINNSDFEL